MQCPNCSYENDDQAKFCVKCGMPLDMPELPKKPYKWLLLSLLFVFLSAAVGIWMTQQPAAEQDCTAVLEAARDSAVENHYDEAIDQYRQVIDMDPQCIEAYMELADLYIDIEEFEQAYSLLESAGDVVDSQYQEIIEEKQRQIMEGPIN